MIAFSIGVSDPSGVAEARRLVRMVAHDSGLSETDAGRAAIVATEAATNLVKHAPGGELIVRAGGTPQLPVLDLLAVDRGRGMANLAECLRDGYTTAGTAGNGLGAIVRQSSEFDAYSRPGRGTVILSRIAATNAVLDPPDRLQVAGLSLRKKGQHACGDNWTWAAGGGATTILVADGLGHGETAADAANEAVTVFQQSPLDSPVEVLDRVHRALLKTRGAAAIARIDHGRGTLTYAGVGNIAATIETDASPRHPVSRHGTLGHQVRRLQDFAYPWSPTDVLVMHSDGASAHWSLAAYPGLRGRHPLVIAAVLLRDLGRDDATVVVARAAPGHAGGDGIAP
ncbi:MAG: SpoIIE family protein phosphatase [Acidobacteria bacterium]|nr:SpoIIE family protein phosphatase [Acidobacteriota bacterium]